MIMNIQQFINSVPYLLKGMLGIFVVTAVIILVVILLNVCSRHFTKKADGNRK